MRQPGEAIGQPGGWGERTNYSNSLLRDRSCTKRTKMSVYTADEAGVRLWFADRGLSEVADNLSGFGWQLSTFTKLFALESGGDELETKGEDLDDDDFIIVRTTLPAQPAMQPCTLLA